MQLSTKSQVSSLSISIHDPSQLKLSGGYTVPQIFINDKGIGGYDQLMSLYQKNKLKELLNE